MNTPLALPLAVIGNTLDWSRYGKGDDADSVSRAAFALKATANAIVSQGMLDSVRRLFEALGSESTSEGADKLQKLAARTGAAFVVPNLVQQVDRLFDPTVYDQSGMGALLQSQVPFARRENKPALNVLGEPVQSGPFHYWASKQSQDPLWRFLADRKVFVPETAKTVMVGNRALGNEYYRALTPDEHYELVAQSGPAIRKNLEQLLPDLQGMSQEDAQRVVGRVADLYHTAAKMQLAGTKP